MKILLIEDDDDDILLLKHALLENKVTYTMDELTAGDEITQYLQQCTDVPDIIVMDLNLPKKHGREILAEIKLSKAFHQVPIVILSTSANPVEIAYTLKMGANQFITKPINKAGYDAAISIITKEVKRKN